MKKNRRSIKFVAQCRCTCCTCSKCGSGTPCVLATCWAVGELCGLSGRRSPTAAGTRTPDDAAIFLAARLSCATSGGARMGGPPRAEILPFPQEIRLIYPMRGGDALRRQEPGATPLHPISPVVTSSSTKQWHFFVENSIKFICVKFHKISLNLYV